MVLSFLTRVPDSRGTRVAGIVLDACAGSVIPGAVSDLVTVRFFWVVLFFVSLRSYARRAALTPSVDGCTLTRPRSSMTAKLRRRVRHCRWRWTGPKRPLPLEPAEARRR
jgi:hypothetical protein